MKNIFCLLLLLNLFLGNIAAQSNWNIGLGYFGHTVTHPGLIVELEKEYRYSEIAALPLRLGLGFYSHPRNHDGVFLDLSFGFRQYYRSGLFLEESVGVGALLTVLNSDGVYEINDNGQVMESSRFNALDFMPSLSLGVGYNFSRHQERQTLLWLRPKVFWQFPHKTSSTFNPALQMGLTFELSGK